MKDKVENSSEFFQNISCEYFPCHKVQDAEKFNCMFCYCPLYLIENCGGNSCHTEKGIKDCSNCLVPHFNRDYVLKKLKEEIVK